MVLTASFVLFPVTGFVATVIPEKLASQELDASIGASEPHDFSVRFSAVRQRHRHVHRIPHPTSVTIAIRPSCEAGWRINKAVSTERRSGIFLRRGLDSGIKQQPDGQIVGCKCERNRRFTLPWRGRVDATERSGGVG